MGLLTDGVGGGRTGALGLDCAASGRTGVLACCGLTGVLASGRTGFLSADCTPVEKGVATTTLSGPLPTKLSGPLVSVMYCVTLVPPGVM